ncbi:MAG: TonB-dependent receptor, partial [Tannerellaceae bacterium]|nr:TonB-dependent receptor [Tannerellaceae bacterium]
MKKINLIILFICCVHIPSFAQSMRGYVYDAKSNEPLIGVNISYKDRGETIGVVTDIEGRYEISLPIGGVEVIFSYIGYENELVPLVISQRELLTRDIYMKQSSQLLADVVVSAGRYEQKLSEITVSMDLLKAEDLARQAPTDLSESLKNLPGVDVNDKQPSIRGGSGWTYGVGARSQILVDGMSILSPGNGEINWNTIPMENVEQVEIMKGASSVLYGSSALNGIINVRTARPGLTPKTKINMYLGIYGTPDNESYQWWDKGLWENDKYPVEPFMRRNVLSGIRNPIYEGIDVSHTRRIGDFDVSGGMNVFTDEGYREFGYNKRVRVGGNITYHQPGMNIVNYGVNTNFITNSYGEFFIWRSPTEAYRPSAISNMGREGNTFYIDPFYNFTNPRNNTSHKVKGRFYYRGDNIVQPDAGSSIVDILGNMGTDITTITNIINNNDYSLLTPLLPAIVTGNIGDIVNAGTSVLGEIFPTATTSDYMDLIGWFMKHGLPSLDGSDIVSWGAGVLNPKQEKTVIDKHLTYYLDYQFSKKFNTAQITAGTTYEHAITNSLTTGNHNSDNGAIYFQYDQRFFDRLGISVGFRSEYYRVDSYYREAETKFFGTTIPVKPIFRGGLNYQLAEYSFLRASFGQGYRYPSLTEKYARKDIGGAGVYPNPDVKAEKGINAEIGIKQGYKIGNFQGFLDMAAFYTQYTDMIEFHFGIFDNTSYEYINSTQDLISMLSQRHFPGVGAQFYNVSKARIYGLDMSTQGVWNITPGSKLVYNFGYVYLVPEDVDYKKRNEEEKTYTDPLQMKEKSNESKYLKYRQKHTIKGTFDYEWKRLSIGTNMTWKSKTLAVDYLMVDERPKIQPEVMDYVRELLFGNIDGETLGTYWENINKPYFLMDLRAGIKVTKDVQVQFSINNLFNKEYSVRPMS